jgi:hypothetical protein
VTFLEDLMRLGPVCEAEVGGEQCRKPAAVRLTLTHEKRSAPQGADLCSRHMNAVGRKAGRQGYKVVVTKYGSKK